MYKLACIDCDKFYTGQTGKNFIEWFNEHKPKNKNILEMKSTFALNLVDNQHTCKGIQDHLTPIHLCNKGRYMDTIEEFEMYKARIVKWSNNFKSNVLFDRAINISNTHK